jgi:hypothetical protein
MADYIRDLRPAKWGSGISLRGSNRKPPMSALGQKRTLRWSTAMSAIPPKADIPRRLPDVRFVPKADIPRCGRNWRYSITSSARASIVCGIVMPSLFAVLALTISSNLVGICTGRSLGFSPLRMRST